MLALPTVKRDSKMQFKILNRWSGNVQFECEISDEQPSYMHWKLAIKIAIKCGADLCGANLRGADLRGAKNADLVIAQTVILPDGDIIGWKKLQGDVIAKLLIPSDAKHSSASGRKCRAEFAKVIEVIGAEFGISKHDGKTKYIAGEIVRPDFFDDDRWSECAPGIHFFITRIEAENY